MSKTTFILMKTLNPKVGMLTEMEYSGSKVISRKSSGFKIARKDWNQKTISVKQNTPGASEINQHIKTRLIKTSGRKKQSFEKSDEQCAIQYLRNIVEKQKRMGSIIESTYIKYNTIVNNFEAICDNINGGKITFNDLRELSVIDMIITELKISKNPKKIKNKDNSTIYNYMSVLATYVKKWNASSGTQFPINTQTFFNEIGKSNIKHAIALSEEEINTFKNYEPKGNGDFSAQIRAKSIFMFQYNCAGIRIQDAFLLSNNQITDSGINLKIKKSNDVIHFPYNFEMALAISPFYSNDFNQVVNETTLGLIDIPIEILKDILRIGGIEDFTTLNLKDLEYVKEQVELNHGKTSNIIPSIIQLKFELEHEITKLFFKKVKDKPTHFIFPYLNWVDFADVHNNSILFNQEHCRLIACAENKHIRNLKTISDNTGLPKLGGHTPRHTFSNHLNKWGFSIGQIQSALGHSSPITTERYLNTRHPSKIANDTLASAHLIMNSKR